MSGFGSFLGGIVNGAGNLAGRLDSSAANFGQDINSHAARLAHWIVYGQRPGAGLNAVPGQLAAMFNPTTKSGAANLVSMFAGGPDGEFMGPGGDMLPNPGMPGKFEPYAPGKAAAGGHLSSDRIPEAILHGIKTGRARNVHDALFGGEAHAKGPIPRQPGAGPRFVEPPRSTNEVIGRAAQNRASILDEARARAARQAMRRKVDERLGSAPMAGKIGQRYPEHDATLLHGPSEIAHPNFIRAMLRRQAQIRGFHHPN